MNLSKNHFDRMKYKSHHKNSNPGEDPGEEPLKRATTRLNLSAHYDQSRPIWSALTNFV